MTPDPLPPLRSLPSVDRVLRSMQGLALPRVLMTKVIRQELAAWRAQAVQHDDDDVELDATVIIQQIHQTLLNLHRRRLRPVINGTGIIIHTNLGRSPLAAAAVAAVTSAAADYCNLEYDLAHGQRGGRGAYVERQLALLCHAEAATVVNNGAAALVLVLRQLATASRPKVIISRGELIQIGGGFRVPDILEASGAVLKEVGTTNKTTLEDYRGAMDDQSGLILKVHRSNFYMDGFVESPSTESLAGLAHEQGVPLVEDLGSGALVATETLGGGEHEPTPDEVLGQGADLVIFSGDKLLGGPQAGIIAGAQKHIDALKKHPMFRALRCDKLVLAGLQATVDLHLHGRGDEVPVLAMMRCSTEALRRRAEQLLLQIPTLPIRITIEEGQAQVGGGSLPRTTLASITLDVHSPSPDALASKLRAAEPPVIGYVKDGRLKLDLRTVLPHQDELLVQALVTAMG